MSTIGPGAGSRNSATKSRKLAAGGTIHQPVDDFFFVTVGGTPREVASSLTVCFEREGRRKMADATWRAEREARK
jgi:hypothetical protein